MSNQTISERVPTTSSFRPPRGPLLIAIGAAGVWISFLTVLAATSANPVTLNWAQIQQSEVVLVGKVTGKSTVTKTDLGEWPLQDVTSIQLNNLQATGAKQGETYIFALLVIPPGDAGHEIRYVVTPSMLPDGAPLIYPATPEAIEQMHQILPAKP